MGEFGDLLVYKKAFKLAMAIYEISKRFPKEEKYSLTDQIRRSSRSVCTNFAEAYRRRRYPNYFLSKLSDSDTENAETGVWLDFALACKYITESEIQRFVFTKRRSRPVVRRHCKKSREVSIEQYFSLSVFQSFSLRPAYFLFMRIFLL
jgi:four helix bundle protein